MRMPSRSQYADGSQFLADLNVWVAKEEAVFQHLRGMFDATGEYLHRPDWVSSGSIKHVWMAYKPDETSVEVALHNLAGLASHAGEEIKRICHGPFENGWAVFAEVQPI